MIYFLFPLSAIAQKSDTLVKKDFRPTGIRIGTDLLSLIRNPIDDSFNGSEFSADVDFYRYYLVAEVGQWKRNFSTPDETYVNDGSYWRVGVDVNFLKKDEQKNMFFLGVRYASGIFNEQLDISLGDTWNSGSTSYSNTNTRATWAEATGGLRVKMWKYFWMGYTARYKFALNTKEQTNLVPHDVPGYGKTNKSSTWGFNYQLFFRIPFKGEGKEVK